MCVFAIDDYDAVTFIQKFQWSKCCLLKQHFLCFFSLAHIKMISEGEREACTLRIHKMCIHIQIVRVEASAKIVCLIFSFLLLLLLLLQLLSISVYLFWLIQHDYVTFFRRIFFVITTNLYFAETNCYHF